jgi:hypothetical protein
VAVKSRYNNGDRTFGNMLFTAKKTARYRVLGLVILVTLCSVAAREMFGQAEDQHLTSIDNMFLKLSIEPLNFDGNAWGYRITWARIGNRPGSLYLSKGFGATAAIFSVDPASQQGSVETPAVLAPNERYRIVFYGRPNRQGFPLGSKIFVVPPGPTGSLPKAGFPNITVETFDATKVHPDARRFQLADYDSKRNQVIFYPEGDFPFPFVRRPTALGTLLTYDVSREFKDPASYHAYDLTKLVDPSAGGFCGGFLDEKDDYAYVVPLYKIIPKQGPLSPSSAPNGLAVKVDLSKDLNTPAAYQKFDFGTLGLPQTGYCDGIGVNGYEYFVPVREIHSKFNGLLLRYDSSKDFRSRSAWSWFDLTTINPDASGFQSVAYAPPYIYLVPFFKSVLVRYNTTLPLQSASSYEAFDLKNVTSEAIGLTGAVVVGHELALIPWDEPKRLRAITIALLYDTKKPLSARESWNSIDLKKVNPRAGGYQFGWLDRNGFVWFVPDNYLFFGVPPLITWNSRLPFDQPSSWNTYPSTGIPPSTGAAYDPKTNTAWLAPYGTAKNYSIAQIRIHEE